MIALAAAGVLTPAGAVVHGETVNCPAAAVRTVIAAPAPLLDWTENAGFDATGALWVSRPGRGVVERYDAAGTLTGSVPVELPGAVRLGPDGLLYVTTGNFPTSALVGRGGVIRFDPAAAQPIPETVISGLGMANGADFDSHGNLYVGVTYAGPLRVRPDGSADTAWTAAARGALGLDNLGVGGLAVHGDSLYVALLHSPTGRIMRIPLDDPGHPVVAADLSPALFTAPALPDDLAVGPDGRLYVGTVTGQLVRVDPETHLSCTVLTGEPVTAVVAVPGSPDELYLTSEAGDLRRVRLR
ncbi:SMP-30/gluconolactonase/LRE family protein [Nocardia yamanashiensis]|uniref:SMP-30/gluconolactonase/LRE family protein n=1 Tax=Nocardia yamanashiensis TaxID=209247 RepID=UPI001E5576AF|nr:SMP-30/gluconolactonase/LRE family protein [Nocardia yamanashiensis]UGT42167.1 SMP-30/gluconolactonase/LRE family protein [Nocardia yamanashiensis]